MAMSVSVEWTGVCRSVSAKMNRLLPIKLSNSPALRLVSFVKDVQKNDDPQPRGRAPRVCNLLSIKSSNSPTLRLVRFAKDVHRLDVASRACDGRANGYT